MSDEQEAPKKKGKKTVLPHVQAAIDKRREIVASLAARGMRQIEITNQLSSPIIKRRENGQMKEYDNPSYMINPESGEPWDKSTINRDIAALRAQWRKAALVDSDDYFGAQMAELEEVKRRMWAKDDMWGVARAIELEVKLTGTAKPQKLEHSWNDAQLGKVDKMADLFKLMREREAENKSGDSNP